MIQFFRFVLLNDIVLYLPDTAIVSIRVAPIGGHGCVTYNDCGKRSTSEFKSVERVSGEALDAALRAGNE